MKSGVSIAFVSKTLNVVLRGPDSPHLETIIFDIGQLPSKTAMASSHTGFHPYRVRLRMCIDYLYAEALASQSGGSEAESAPPSSSSPNARSALHDEHNTCAQWNKSVAGPGCNQQNGLTVRGDAESLEKLFENSNRMSFHHLGAIKIGRGYQQNGQTLEIIGDVSDSSNLLNQIMGRSTWTDSTCLPANSQSTEGSAPGTLINGHTIIFRRLRENDGA
ncbi:hypothetical protein FSARC_12444 [Fusarium sarcochroum]|uniref:Uncharacterized protein n=1 Tax=Fusarium sarcochroum TaxID=1208366 RepID=A0A8H4WX43_9HYPO|nr:hypothetical protein FSARC_12444 [Fusarium sarcochroum]